MPKKSSTYLDRMTFGQSLYSTATTKKYQNSNYQATSDAAISGRHCTSWICTRSQYSNALDVFAAANIAAKTDEAMKAAIVLLLDFAKAYDTLQRPFLLEVLK